MAAIPPGFEDPPPCEFCGRCLWAGGPCCRATQAILEAQEKARKEVEHARACQAKADKGRARMRAEMDSMYERGFQAGCVVGAAIVAWAEEIRRRCTCLSLDELEAKRGPGLRTWDEVCERCKGYL